MAGAINTAPKRADVKPANMIPAASSKSADGMVIAAGPQPTAPTASGVLPSSPAPAEYPVQAPPVDVTPPIVTEATGTPCPEPSCCSPTPSCCEPTPPRYRTWASTEYLLWWIQRGPLPVPLVSTTSNLANIGALNEPGTMVLFGAGGTGLDYRSISGMRLTVGGWINHDQSIGIEASGFLLEHGSVNFAATSAGGAAPIVSIPFNATVPFNLNPAGETSLNAGGVPNQVTVSSGTQLWGAEANFVLGGCHSECFYLRPFAGARYLDLRESLNLIDQFFDGATGGGLLVRDSFATRNQFYGGQLGLHAGWTPGRFTVDLTTKVALGTTHEVLNVNGASTVTLGAFGFPTGITTGGVFAEPSNIGHFSRDVFTVVPEGQLEVGFYLTPNLRIFAGYTFLFDSNVLRPGNQIDRNINPTQSVLFGGTNGVLVGPPSPLQELHRSEFWAQGVSFGVTLRY
jgi:hypothetical protein